MLRVMVFLAAGVALVAAACGGGGALNPDDLTPGPPSRDLHIVAKSLKFDRNVLSAPAGAEISLTFANNESVPHNVAIYTDKSAKERVFAGEAFSGKKTEVYTFKAPSPGRYYFRCDVHPTMDGYLFVQ